MYGFKRYGHIELNIDKAHKLFRTLLSVLKKLRQKTIYKNRGWFHKSELHLDRKELYLKKQWILRKLKNWPGHWLCFCMMVNNGEKTRSCHYITLVRINLISYCPFIYHLFIDFSTQTWHPCLLTTHLGKQSTLAVKCAKTVASPSL